MHIRIDLDDPKPLEEQIVVALRQALAQGHLAPGAELPSVRQLAGDLGVHWNTVARAYRRLGDEGLVTVRRGRGVVASEKPRISPRLTRAALRDRLSEILATAVLAGLSRRDITNAFREALAGFGERAHR